MQSHWANSAPYYRCRSPAEYALANRVEHPLNVCLREDAILADVDGWLAREFAPHRLRRTIAGLAAAGWLTAVVPVRAVPPLRLPPQAPAVGCGSQIMRLGRGRARITAAMSSI